MKLAMIAGVLVLGAALGLALGRAYRNGEVMAGATSGAQANANTTKNAGESGVTPTTGDPVRGRLVFERRCTGCHAMESNREGPMLNGVFGRKAGTAAGFSYSDSLKNSHLTWDEATLEKWLTDPEVLVPGNNMDFSVPKADERRDLIAYYKRASTI